MLIGKNREEGAGEKKKMAESKLQKYTQSAISIAQEATGPNLGYFRKNGSICR